MRQGNRRISANLRIKVRIVCPHKIKRMPTQCATTCKCAIIIGRMSRKKTPGICHICGANTKLTFEHVPPRAAFNDKPMVGVRMEELLRNRSMEAPKGPVSQLGAGAYTLCGRCNNDTGGWYGNAFVDWAYQGLVLSQHALQAPSLYHIFHIFSLRILKQIICMFFSANGEDFQRIHPDLVKFVLDKEARYLDPRFGIYVFFTVSPGSRQTGMIGSADIEGKRSLRIFSELTFPPFGYVMTLNSTPPEGGMVNISFFANFHYNDWKDIPLRIPFLSIFSPVPGDYRDRESY